MAENKEDTPHFHGHRERLRTRFFDAGAETLPDYELLELVLCRSIKRQDVKPIAKDLLKRFGSFAEVLGASLPLLKECKGVGENTAADLKIVEAAAQRYARGSVAVRRTLSSMDDVVTYCRAAMAFAEREQVRILFLDKRNGLIADEIQQTGTVDHTPFYPREVIKRSLELSASALILVHNHPSGDATPSAADIRSTKEIAAIAEPLGITLHDHIVVGRHGFTSMKASGLV